MANQSSLPLAGNTQSFKFNNRTVRVVYKDDTPWFAVTDVCRILGHTNPTTAIVILDESEKAKLFLGSGSPANVISESGLYKLIMRSNKAEAKSFQDWVTKEVLPAIRKHGEYVMGQKIVQGIEAMAKPAPTLEYMQSRFRQPPQPALEDKATNKHPNYELAGELAALAAKAVFEAVLLHGEGWLRNQRLVMSCQGGRTRPSIKPVPHDAYIASMARFTQMVDEGVFLNVSDLAKLAAACNGRLAKCMG